MYLVFALMKIEAAGDDEITIPSLRIERVFALAKGIKKKNTNRLIIDHAKPLKSRFANFWNAE